MAITKVGLSTNDFAPTLRDLPRALAQFKALGAESAEISLGSMHVVLGAKIVASRLAELKKICADSELAMTVHGPIASSFTDRRHRRLQIDACRAALEVSGEIQAAALVTHAGATPTGDAAERAALYAEEREALAELGPFAQGCGVPLCVENIFGDDARWFAGPHELAAQVRAVGHPFIRATIDFSHAAINATVRGYDLMSALAELAPVAGHLHVHDSFGVPRTFQPYGYGDATMFGLGDLHLPPGWGVLDWDAIARLPYGHDVVANLELMKSFEAELPEAIALCQRMVKLSSA